MHCARCFFYDVDAGDEVCGRCGRAYMPEANVYLGLLVFVTGGMAWTLRHLLTGNADPFVRPALDLGAWAAWPVSIVDRPAYGLVVGAYLAMLALGPIMTAVLYGRRGGLLLALIEALLGPSLALPAAAAVGVFIVGSHALRLSSKLASLLLGLVPSAAYWFVAVAVSKVESLAPALRGLTYVPPVAAVGFATAGALLLVAIGRADRWHVRWPGAVLAVMAAGPVMALVAFVGVDEIRFQIMCREPLAQRGLLIQRYTEFLGRHPKSARAAEVRAQLALALENAYAEAAGSGGILLHAAPPEKIWMELVEQNPDSPWAADARLHIGDTAAAGGDFDHADQYYREALARTAGTRPPAADPLADFSVLNDLFTIGSDLRVQEAAAHLATVRQDVLDRLALLRENRPGSEAATRALALYVKSLACKAPRARRALLEQVKAADPAGPLADNVAHDLALVEPDEDERLAKLEALAAAHRETDGAMLARLSAAEILIPRGTREGVPPDATWLWQAQRHLEDVQAELVRRREHNPEDPCVAALADRVEKRLLYVRARIRSPEPGRGPAAAEPAPRRETGSS